MYRLVSCIYLFKTFTSPTPLALQLQQPPAVGVIIDAYVSDHFKPGLMTNMTTYLLPKESLYNFIASYSKATFFKFAFFLAAAVYYFL